MEGELEVGEPRGDLAAGMVEEEEVMKVREMVVVVVEEALEVEAIVPGVVEVVEMGVEGLLVGGLVVDEDGTEVGDVLSCR